MSELLSTSYAKCGSLGPMICLHGSYCNETAGGICEGCPVGFRDDQALFIGNKNCGMSEQGMYAVYILTTLMALSVGLWGLRVAIPRKKSSMRRLLYLVFIWNSLIPCLCLSHYLEGFRNGTASIILYTTILFLVNTQVWMNMYHTEKFLSILCSYSVSNKLVWKHVAWYVFWMTIKLVCGILLMVGEQTSNIQLYNNAQMTLAVSLLIEVACNVMRAYYSAVALVKTARMLHGSLSMDSNPIVLEFSERIRKARFIAPFYGLILCSLGTYIIVMFVIFNSSVPYVYIFWALIVFTWPIVGLRPIFLLKSKLGKHMERSKKGSANKDEAGLPTTPTTTSDSKKKVRAAQQENSVSFQTTVVVNNNSSTNGPTKLVDDPRSFEDSSVMISPYSTDS